MKEIKHIRTHCLSDDELRKLLYHPDNIENQSILFDHISGCEFCSDAYDGLKALNEKEYSQHITQLNEKIEEHLDNSNKRIVPIRRWIVISASFLLLFSLTYYLNQYFSSKKQELAQIQPQQNTEVISNDETTIVPTDSLPVWRNQDMNKTSPVLIKPEYSTITEKNKNEEILQEGAYKNIRVTDSPEMNNDDKPIIPATSAPQKQSNNLEDLPSTAITDNSIPVDHLELHSESVTISTESDRKIKKQQRSNSKINSAPVVIESSEKGLIKEITASDSTEINKNILTEKLLQYAQNAYDQNQFQQAISLCNQIVSRNDANKDNALLLKGKCLYKLGNKNDGLQLLQELIKRKSPLSNEAQQIIDSH